MTPETPPAAIPPYPYVRRRFAKVPKKKPKVERHIIVF